MFEESANILNTDNMIVLLFLIVAITIILLILLNKISSSTVLYVSMRKFFGLSNPMTTYFLGKIVRKMIKEEGVTVSQIEIVHQFGNCYQGLAVIDGEKVNLSVTADKYGTVGFETY